MGKPKNAVLLVFSVLLILFIWQSARPNIYSTTIKVPRITLEGNCGCGCLAFHWEHEKSQNKFDLELDIFRFNVSTSELLVPIDHLYPKFVRNDKLIGFGIVIPIWNLLLVSIIIYATVSVYDRTRRGWPTLPEYQLLSSGRPVFSAWSKSPFIGAGNEAWLKRSFMGRWGPEGRPGTDQDED